MKAFSRFRKDELAKAAAASAFVDLDADEPRFFAEPVDPPNTTLPAPAHPRTPLLVSLGHLLLGTAAMSQRLPLLWSNGGLQCCMHSIQKVQVGERIRLRTSLLRADSEARTRACDDH